MISVLIPAFRPTYLHEALASVLTQGVSEFELVVSDDSGGDAVREVVERFRDPRIRYVRTPGRLGFIENARRLWQEARYPLLKYLCDDDILLPNALATLAELAQAHPEASYYFGHRHIIDERGRITSRPELMREDTVVRFHHHTISRAMVARVENRIGELSNVLINAAVGFGPEALMLYQGFELEVLGDFGLFLNATDRAAAFGRGRAVAGFRRHPQQMSQQGWSPQFAKGLCEWELFVRGEFARGVLDQPQALRGVEALAAHYHGWRDRLPELTRLQAGLDGLKQKIRAGDTDVFDAGFRAAWAEMDELVRRRAAAAGSGPPQAAGATA